MNARAFTRRVLQAACIAAAMSWATVGNTAIVYQTGGNSISIPGLTGFMTTGDLMDGLEITATFSGGVTEAVSWADTGPGSGGATGTGWGISLTGDTFTADWDVTISDQNLGQLRSLLLDGLNTFTVFDRTEPDQGTNGSASGRDWECRSAGLCDDAIVTYDFQVSIGAAPPVGDLWQTVFVDFFFPDAAGGPDVDHGPRTDFVFGQDTDNDARLRQVAEPGSLALLALILGALGIARRWIKADA